MKKKLFFIIVEQRREDSTIRFLRFDIENTIFAVEYNKLLIFFIIPELDPAGEAGVASTDGVLVGGLEVQLAGGVVDASNLVLIRSNGLTSSSSSSSSSLLWIQEVSRASLASDSRCCCRTSSANLLQTQPDYRMVAEWNDIPLCVAHRPNILPMFRNLYRETWAHPEVKQFLGHVKSTVNLQK